MNIVSKGAVSPWVAGVVFAGIQPDAEAMSTGWLATIIVVAVLSGLVYWYAACRRRKRRKYSHEYLFADLCALHQFDRPTRNLLRQLARCHNLAHPARMFLEPVWLDPQQLPPPLRGRADEIAKLRTALFGIEATPPQSQQA